MAASLVAIFFGVFADSTSAAFMVFRYPKQQKANAMQTVKRVNLFFTQGSSDKEYQVSLYQDEKGYYVETANGRRGKPLRPLLKTPEAVALDAAEKIYEKAIKAKTSKGYTECESGDAFVGSKEAGEITDFKGMQPNPITLEDARKLIAREPTGWVVGQKHDGERCFISANAETGEVYGANRKGLKRPLPEKVVNAILGGLREQEITECKLDGELMDGWYAIFDVLSWNGTDQRNCTLEARRWIINADLCDTFNASDVIHVECLLDAELAFEQMFADTKAAGAEGVVLKSLTSIYDIRRPATGGHILKLKHTADDSFVVHQHNEGKRSVGISAYDANGILVEVGNVTIPVNHDIPAIGTIIDVNYLYAYEGGSIFQPVFKKVRSDIYAEDCVLSKLKYKVEQSFPQPLAA